MVRDYAIGATALRKNIYPGQTAQFNGNVSPIFGYNFVVDLTCAAGASAPPATCNIAPTTVTPPQNFTLTAGDNVIQDFNFAVHGVGHDSATLKRSLSLTLGVVDLSVGALSANSITMPQSSVSQPITFKLTPQGSFDFPVTLDCPSMPAGATCVFNGVTAPATVTFSGQPLTVALTVQTDNAIAAGTYSNLPISVTTNPARPGNLPPLTQLAFSLTVTAPGGSTDVSVSDSSADAIGHAIGAPFTLTFAVKNAGTAVTQAKAFIALPHPVWVQSASLSGIAGACGSLGLTDTVTCDNGGAGFSMGASQTRTLTVVVVPAFGRSLTGQVVVNSELPDSNVGNNSAGFTRQIRPRPFAIRGLPAILP